MSIGLDTSMVLATPGTGEDGTPAPDPADPKHEYATAYGVQSFLRPLEWGEYEGFFCRHPHRDYVRMMRDETIASSLKAFKAAVLSGPLRLTPAVQASDDADGKADPDAQLAAEIYEECKRSQRRLEFTTPSASHLWEMMDAMAECHKLAEPVMELDPEADGVRYRLGRVKVKPRWSYRFEVDRAMNPTAIQAYTVDGEWKRLPPRHFVWLTWDPKEGDPRGNSVLDECHHAWTMLTRLWPYALDGWETFGEPILYGTVGPNAEMVPVRDAKGSPIPGAPPLTPQKAMSVGMAKLRGGAKVAGSHGSDIKVIESGRDNVTMTNAIGLLQGRMVRAILLQVRATVEAKTGSKADSETSMDVLGTLVRFGRSWVCSYWRRVLWCLVAANHGEAVADRLTPEVSLGDIEPRDFIAFAQAIGLLFQSGYFSEAQLPYTDQMMNFPQRRPGAVRVGPQKDNAGTTGEPTPAEPPATPADPAKPGADAGLGYEEAVAFLDRVFGLGRTPGEAQ